jgi:hypothetical protein
MWWRHAFLLEEHLQSVLYLVPYSLIWSIWNKNMLQQVLYLIPGPYIAISICSR